MSGRRNPAVFLDRDGTIIRQVELLHSASQVQLLSHVAEAIRLFNEASLSVIVITNQPVVARGISSPDDVSNIHHLLSKRLARRKAHIDAFYFCPHHPDATIERYRQICECRKPNPGLIFKAATDHDLDLRNSVMIGDTTQDILAGHRAGLSTILVGTGHGGRDPWQYHSRPDFEAPNLLAAAHLWLARLSE